MDMNSISIMFLMVVACCALLWCGLRGLQSGVARVKGGRMAGRGNAPFNYRLLVWTCFIAGSGGMMFVVFSRWGVVKKSLTGSGCCQSFQSAPRASQVWL
jgi:hypothetical protein